MKHYVYTIIDPKTEEFYFGSRSFDGDINDDPYMGSMKTWAPEDMSRLVKEVMKDDFESRDSAIEYESKLIEEHINDELNRNYYIPHRGFHTFGIDINSLESYINRHGKVKGTKLYNDRCNHLRQIQLDRLSNMTERERKETFGQPGMKNPNYGKKWSNEIKQRISRSVKDYYKNRPGPNNGRIFNDEWRNKISESRRNLKLSKGKNNPNWIGFIKITDLRGKERLYETSLEAAKDLNVDAHTLRNKCRANETYQRGKYKGWKFELVKD